MVYASNNASSHQSNFLTVYGQSDFDLGTPVLGPYIELNGEITLENTSGYLNAEQYPLLRFYLIMTLVYLFLDGLWLIQCLRHRPELILLHHFLSLILATQTVQAAFYTIEYYLQNSQGTVLFSFIFTSILFNVCRNTLARVLILVMALGTGIIAANAIRMPQRRPKIIALSVLYFLANTAYLIAVQVNQTRPLSPSV
jgi:Lung seven transmembrane receptor